MYIRLINTTKNKTWTKTMSLSPNPYVYFLARNTSDLSLEAKNEVEVYAATNAGYANVDSCLVYGSVYEM